MAVMVRLVFTSVKVLKQFENAQLLILQELI